jgi:hypothetical protein
MPDFAKTCLMVLNIERIKEANKTNIAIIIVNSSLVYVNQVLYGKKSHETFNVWKKLFESVIY